MKLLSFPILSMVLFYFLGIPHAMGFEPIAEGNITYPDRDIRIVLDHIFISGKNGSLEISETVIFRNEGAEIRYSRENHTYFAISTPPGIENLKTEAMECCLVQEDGVVLMDPMHPVKPGESFEMKIRYMLPSTGYEYVFNKSAVYNTTSLSIFINSDLISEGSYEAFALRENRYKVTTFSDLEAGYVISVPVKISEKPGYPYAWIGLLGLFLIGAAYRFKAKIFRREGREYTLEKLELEKRRIFQTIYGFERHAGTENSDEYRRLMKEYRQRAIQILIKIDKIRKIYK